MPQFLMTWQKDIAIPAMYEDESWVGGNAMLDGRFYHNAVNVV